MRPTERNQKIIDVLNRLVQRKRSSSVFKSATLKYRYVSLYHMFISVNELRQYRCVRLVQHNEFQRFQLDPLPNVILIKGIEKESLKTILDLLHQVPDIVKDNLPAIVSYIDETECIFVSYQNIKYVVLAENDETVRMTLPMFQEIQGEINSKRRNNEDSDSDSDGDGDSDSDSYCSDGDSDSDCSDSDCSKCDSESDSSYCSDSDCSKYDSESDSSYCSDSESSDSESSDNDNNSNSSCKKERGVSRRSNRIRPNTTPLSNSSSKMIPVDPSYPWEVSIKKKPSNTTTTTTTSTTSSSITKQSSTQQQQQQQQSKVQRQSISAKPKPNNLHSKEIHNYLESAPSFESMDEIYSIHLLAVFYYLYLLPHAFSHLPHPTGIQFIIYQFVYKLCKVKNDRLDIPPAKVIESFINSYQWLDQNMRDYLSFTLINQVSNLKNLNGVKPHVRDLLGLYSFLPKQTKMLVLIHFKTKKNPIPTTMDIPFRLFSTTPLEGLLSIHDTRDSMILSKKGGYLFALDRVINLDQLNETDLFRFINGDRVNYINITKYYELIKNERMYSLSKMKKQRELNSLVLDHLDVLKHLQIAELLRRREERIALKPPTTKQTTKPTSNRLTCDQIREELNLDITSNRTNNVFIVCRESACEGSGVSNSMLQQITLLLSMLILITTNNTSSNLPTSYLPLDSYHLVFIMEVISSYWFLLKFRKQMELFRQNLDARDLVIMAGFERLTRNASELKELLDLFRKYGNIIFVDRLKTVRIETGTYLIDFAFGHVYRVEKGRTMLFERLPISMDEFEREIMDIGTRYFALSNEHGLYSKRHHITEHWINDVLIDPEIEKFMEEMFGFIDRGVYYARTSPPRGDRVFGKSINSQVKFSQLCIPNLKYACVRLAKSANPLGAMEHGEDHRDDRVILYKDNSDLDIYEETRSEPTRPINLFIENMIQYAKKFIYKGNRPVDKDLGEGVSKRDSSLDPHIKKVLDLHEIDTGKIQPWIMVFTGIDRLSRNEADLPDIIKFATALNCMLVGFFPPSEYLETIQSDLSAFLSHTIHTIREHCGTPQIKDMEANHPSIFVNYLAYLYAIFTQRLTKIREHIAKGNSFVSFRPVLYFPFIVCDFIIPFLNDSLVGAKRFHEASGFTMNTYDLDSILQLVIQEATQILQSNKRTSTTDLNDTNKLARVNDDNNNNNNNNNSNNNTRKRLTVQKMIAEKNPSLKEILESWVNKSNVETIIREVVKLLQFNDNRGIIENAIYRLVKEYHNLSINGQSNTSVTHNERIIVERIQRLHRVEMFNPENDYSLDNHNYVLNAGISMSGKQTRQLRTVHYCPSCKNSIPYLLEEENLKKYYCSSTCALADGVKENSEIFKAQCQQFEFGKQCSELTLCYLTTGTT
ncbi:hypothetical protein PPL_11686 [Heterostelium album PN500]|uniref:Uncharacterized protein n=1 Tax=Heterostelium pallidum (strain ATCC 26659 / Pp 5 / PN500) TaxID=670386 RepID=D3BU67_HETP5|nr:hypothetical protein PPL_11686 [Heterostelium album PN500]EFA75001.1 hypothetical protein PPL_11686 [Heterostelium album PN500]|eukprot:XP_020427135.1 hypothetical protein PPL_11686 [Heterostelium album PN500]